MNRKPHKYATLPDGPGPVAGDEVRVIIFRMEQVPSADVTGLVAMEGVLKEMTLGKEKLFVHPRLLRLLGSEAHEYERYA